MVTEPNICEPMLHRLGLTPRTPATWAREELERAVLAERERCAVIAEHWDEQYSDRSDSVRVAGLEIAAKIREGVDA